MNSSSGGDTSSNSGVRAVPYTVKYPTVQPVLYVQAQPQGNLNAGNAVKMLPTTNVSYQRSAPVRVTAVPTTTTHPTLLQQNSSRSLLNKPQNPVNPNLKNNQTIVVANAAGQVRSVPATVVMGSGTHKKQLITIGNSIPANPIPIIDPKNVKVIGTIFNKKGSESPNHTQEPVMINPVTPDATYIFSKSGKPIPQMTNVVYAPIGQGNRIVLTTEGTLQTKPNITLVQSGTSVAKDTITMNRVQTPTRGIHSPSPAEILDDDSSDGKTKYLMPVNMTYKAKKLEESLGNRLQGTSLGQMISANAANSVTNFQISNGQIVTEKLQKPRMLSMLYDECGVEVSKPESPSEGKIEGNNIENHNQSLPPKNLTVEDEVEITRIVPVVENVPKPSAPPANKNRRKQSLAVKTDAIPVRKEIPVENKEVNHLEKRQERVSVESEEKSDYESDFDPLKALDWTDNVGSLPFSDLKFRINEFGLIEMIDEDDEEGKISSKSSVVSDIEKNDKKKSKDHRNSDEILQCHSCGTYGMGCEFVSSRFCSVACSKAYAEEKAQSAKKLQEKQEKKMKLRQQKMLLLQQRVQLEKLGLHEAKVAIEEKLKMLKMERELMKTTGGDSDFDGGTFDRVRNSRNLFSWTRYLTMLKAKSAPYTLFKDPFPNGKNNFKIGMKLEGIDPVHPSLFCVLTVSAVRGYRIKLHFDGYPDCHDFWVNANSSDIFHAGWCERTNHKLCAPKGYGEKNFNWGHYLRMKGGAAAPKTCFVNNQEKTIIPSGFRAGMKLEAVDKKNSSLVCVATIADVLDNRILVHFDSWDDIYDYWVDHTSPYIHPVGWCKENGHQLTPPNGKF